jgi:hypothetical protein
MGGGWADYDQDGDLDLFMAMEGNPSNLFRNDVNIVGGFVKVSKDDATGEGILWDSTGSSRGTNWADFDGDDDIDLIITNSNGLTLYLNQDGVFVASATSGLSAVYAAGVMWAAAAGDYDLDGDLDLIFSGVDQGSGANRQPTCIYQNDGTGIFTNVADELIGFNLNLESWNPQWLDVDNDGDLDAWLPTMRTVTVSGEAGIEPCALLLNDGGSALNYADSNSTFLAAKSAITSGWADYDNDGDLDLFLIPFSGDAVGVSRFFRNDGVTGGYPVFANIAGEIGLDSAWTDSRGVCWGDFDNDGWQDLLIGRRNSPQKLYHNNGEGLFIEVAAATGAGITGRDPRSVMFVDYDNDGFLDIFLHGQNTMKWLLHNGGNANHWIVIKPKGTTNNYSGLGARVRVVTGATSQIREIEGFSGSFTNGYVWAHFGLGSVTTVDSIIVRWPNGAVDVSINIDADHYYTFEEGVGIITSIRDNPVEKIRYALYQNYPNPFNPQTNIEFVLAARSNVRLELVNVLGQVVRVLAEGSYTAGHHQISLDGSDLAAGVYLYKLRADKFTQVRKLVLLK